MIWARFLAVVKRKNWNLITMVHVEMAYLEAEEKSKRETLCKKLSDIATRIQREIGLGDVAKDAWKAQINPTYSLSKTYGFGAEDRTLTDLELDSLWAAAADATRELEYARQRAERERIANQGPFENPEPKDYDDYDPYSELVRRLRF
jgi:hypothetical protein